MISLKRLILIHYSLASNLILSTYWSCWNHLISHLSSTFTQYHLNRNFSFHLALALHFPHFTVKPHFNTAYYWSSTHGKVKIIEISSCFCLTWCILIWLVYFYCIRSSLLATTIFHLKFNKNPNSYGNAGNQTFIITHQFHMSWKLLFAKQSNVNTE